MSELTVQNQPNTESVLALKEQQGQYLTFLVGPEKLAINIHEVNEIIEINNYMDDHWERERKRVEDIKNRQPR